MSEVTTRVVFAGACIAGIVIIAVGAGLEILRQKRGESLLRAGQFRLRIFSALVWVILLGSLAYAVAFLWPHGRDQIMMKKFAAVVGGSLSLLLIALLLLAYDVWQIGQQRRLSEMKFNRNLEELAREEIEKVQREQQVGEKQVGEKPEIENQSMENIS